MTTNSTPTESGPVALVALQPPPLTDADYKRIDEGVLPRVMAERRIVWNLIAWLERAGFMPNNVDLGDQLEPTPTAESMMEHAFSVDDCYLHFAPKSGSGGPYWVRPVFGNSGWDVLADQSCLSEKKHATDNDRAWDSAMEDFNKVSKRFI